ncbi:hypothetical protein D3C77_506020 [compost metagenome]
MPTPRASTRAAHWRALQKTARCCCKVWPVSTPKTPPASMSQSRITAPASMVRSKACASACRRNTSVPAWTHALPTWSRPASKSWKSSVRWSRKSACRTCSTPFQPTTSSPRRKPRPTCRVSTACVSATVARTRWTSPTCTSAPVAKASVLKYSVASWSVPTPSRPVTTTPTTCRRRKSVA